MTVIYLDVEQGSQRWLEARAGIPTASNFKRIVTPGGKLSAQREGYQAELLAEWALGVDVSDVWTAAMERGTVLEPEAFQYFSFHTDLEPTKCGLVYRDDSKTVACSPDGLVPLEAVLELKCPSAAKHLMYLARGVCPADYWPQVQGQMWVTGRPACWFMSYHPGLPPFIEAVSRDSKFHDALDTHMPTFIAELLAGRERLRAMGVTPEVET